MPRQVLVPSQPLLADTSQTSFPAALAHTWAGHTGAQGQPTSNFPENLVSVGKV